MHQNERFQDRIFKNFLGRGSPSPLPRPLPPFFLGLRPRFGLRPQYSGASRPRLSTKNLSNRIKLCCAPQWGSLDPPLDTVNATWIWLSSTPPMILHQYNTIQYNNHLVKRSLIETLRERPYSSLAACWDVLVPVPRSYKISVRRQRNYEGPFAQFCVHGTVKSPWAADRRRQLYGSALTSASIRHSLPKLERLIVIDVDQGMIKNLETKFQQECRMSPHSSMCQGCRTGWVQTRTSTWWWRSILSTKIISNFRIDWYSIGKSSKNGWNLVVVFLSIKTTIEASTIQCSRSYFRITNAPQLDRSWKKSSNWMFKLLITFMRRS